MKYFYLLLLVSFVHTIPLSAQSFEVTGTVKDRDNQAISFATVSLLQVVDTTMIKGVSADENGLFKLANVKPNTYFIKASYIRNSSKLVAIDVTKDIAMGTIIIDQNVENLKEVVITSMKPMIERKADRLVFNVENTVVSQGSSWDVLKRTPGVIATQEELQVRNQSATIYINDRKVQLSSQEVRDLLENYPASSIKSVEVINNPPAKYDAEGGPVLNIVTSKNISMGYKGNLSTTYTQSVFPKYTFGTSHFYKTKKLNLFASYNHSPRKDFKNIESETNFINETGIFSRWNTDFDKITRIKSHSAQLNLDYTIDDRNELSFASSALVSPDKEFDNLQFTDMRNAQRMLDSTFITESDLLEDKSNYSADLTYKHNFKEHGSLRLNGHYTKYDFESDQDARSDYYDSNNQFIRTFGFFTAADQDIDIYTTQLDITTAIGSVAFETGLKGSFIESKSGIDFFETTPSGSIFIPNQSDDYFYDEKVYAAYMSASKDWDKFSLKFGLRAEHTESSGFSTSLSEINDLKYFELFPTLHLLFTPKEEHSFSFDYSRKLARPRYGDLNPFRYYINENNFSEGNPNLLPNFSHNFNLNYTLNSEMSFDLYYRDNGNYISTLAFQDNENFVLRDITQNVLESTSYGFDFNYGKSLTDWWYLYNYISIFHEDETFVALESNNQEVTNSVDGVYVDLTNFLNLSKDGTFKGEVGLTYLSGFLEGSYRQEETTNITFGLRKTLWDNKALISLQVNDLLNKANNRISSKYLNQDNAYLPRLETQYVRFGFTVNFGNFRLADNQRDIDKIERDRLKSDQ
ncbi:MAG: TonB-dependent receptor [Maribacter sp.]|nr:TonB-dependent receptor [Maribacter sp.]